LHRVISGHAGDWCCWPSLVADLVWPASGYECAGAIERVLACERPWTWQDLVSATLDMQRPVLPAAPGGADFWYSSLVDWPLDSPRNLLFHVAVTGQSHAGGLCAGHAAGLVLSVLIVHSRTLDRALLPWIVASQTVPVLAIAPIVLVILGSLGFAGVAPKASDRDVPVLFSGHRGHGAGPALAAGDRDRDDAHLCRQPLAGAVAAAPARCAAVSVPGAAGGIAAGLVGAMVAELPTGAQAGLGARLLTGSYYGNTVGRSGRPW
jgi:NitT/TauT family transport system permease protein